MFTRHSETFAIPSVVRTGYAFGGWYENSNFGGEPVTQIVGGSIKDRKFYAKWSKANITVTIAENNDIALSHTESGLLVTFNVTGGTAPYSWRVDDAIQANSIKVLGLNGLNQDGEPVDGIDTDFSPETNGNMTPVLRIVTSVPVTLENLKLTGGYWKSGEVLVVGGSDSDGTVYASDVTIKNGVLITENNICSDPATAGWYPMVKVNSSGSKITMEGGSITGNTAGQGIVCVARGAIFEMTGGAITGNTLYEDEDYSSRSVSCGVYVAAPASDGSLPAGTFKISGDAVVDEVWCGTGAVVTLAGELTNNNPIQIIPYAYENGTQVIAVTTDSGLTLSEASELFTVKANGSTNWSLNTDGKIYEGYISTVSELSSLLSTLSANTKATPYTISIIDNGGNFISANTGISAALNSAGKYANISFVEPTFTSMSGTLSNYVTKLTVPASVTTVGFIDCGENFTGFAVASGNTSLKVQSTTWGSSYSGLVAYQELIHFEKDDTIGEEPEMFVNNSISSEWNTWNRKVQAEWGHYHYAPLPVLLSYDGSTIVACPPAIKLVTSEELMTMYPSTGATLGGMSVSASDYEAGTPEFSCTSARPYIFAGCNTLKSASISITSTTATSANLFYKCPELTYVSLNIPAANIVAYSFTDCTKLSSVKFGNTTTTKVLTDSFSGCTSLSSLWFAAGRGSGSAEAGAYPSTCTVTIDGQVN